MLIPKNLFIYGNIRAFAHQATVFQHFVLSYNKDELFPDGKCSTGQATVLILTAASLNTINLHTQERALIGAQLSSITLPVSLSLPVAAGSAQYSG